MQKNHECKPIIGEQLADIFAIIISEFPHMTFDEAQAIIDNDEAFAADITFACTKNCVRKRVVKQRQAGTQPEQYNTSNIPADGVEFGLTLDGDITDPNEMIRLSDLDIVCKYSGVRIKGKHSGRFKLVHIGSMRNLKEAQEALRKHGKIPVVQWLQAFKQAYPVHDFKGPIAVADPSCRLTFISSGKLSAPCYPSTSNMERVWLKFFFRNGKLDINDSNRWLVAVDEGGSHVG